MIKADDLEIGSRIEAQDPITGTSTIECEVIEIVQMQIILKNGDMQFSINSIDAIPIPVTESLLKQIGFKFAGADAVLPVDNFVLPTKPGVDGWFQDHTFTEKCDHLHQLQNIYKKRTGKSLTLPALKLFTITDLPEANLFKNLKEQNEKPIQTKPA